MKKNPELDKIENESGETHWFTSLYRVALFLGKQRAHVDYHFTKGTRYMGWIISLIDGSDVPWKHIDI